MGEKKLTDDNLENKKERKPRLKKIVNKEVVEVKEEKVEVKEEKVEVKEEKVKRVKKLVVAENKNIEHEFPVEGPNILINIPETLSILMSFFIVNHKYVGLQIIENKIVKPLFFIVLENWSEDNKLKVQLVKHKNEKDSEEKTHVKPLWKELWIEKELGTDVIWNCIPFDETRDYYYFPTEL